ncbi:hypothetical protein [Agilicoccus flavus]|uniref:hypothetical protein n=1 Tax=Agilicoccus flavus TaxID=2775968 RepID=UPI001CF6F51A|nr:hypothetical protein [Agilicoccus flavus]
MLALQVDRTQGVAAAIDGTKRVRWVRRVEQVGYAWTFYPRAKRDSSGNIYLRYDPGRYPSVAVFRPTETGFTDLSSLPGKRYYLGRWYNSELLPVGKDGRHRINHHENTCNPMCAAANYRHRIFRWSGTDFVPVSAWQRGMGPRGL